MAPAYGAPAAPAKMEAPKKASTSATIIVELPVDAKLKFDGAATTSTEAVRRFSTPELDPASAYSYTLTAEIVRDGKTLSVSREVVVRAGEESRIAFSADSFGTVAVAAK
jgi:uncharacterized protein (TIGR03000 family)